jgi:hypothetical protein
MKKNLKILPLLLLGLYYFLVNSNENISFLYKMIILGFIMLVSLSIVYKNIIAKKKSKSSIVIFTVFILLSIILSVYTLEFN